MKKQLLSDIALVNISITIIMNRKLYFTVIFILIFCGICAQNPVGVVKAYLKVLEFAFDAETGSILSMTYPGTGILLQATPDSAGIVDLAYPV